MKRLLVKLAALSGNSSVEKLGEEWRHCMQEAEELAHQTHNSD
jgi:hypothetical protein